MKMEAGTRSRSDSGDLHIPALDQYWTRGIHSSALHTSLVSDRNCDLLCVEAAAVLYNHYRILFDSIYSRSTAPEQCNVTFGAPLSSPALHSNTSISISHLICVLSF
jgi:hypothetical protein